MRAVKSLLPLLILPWMSLGADLHLKNRGIGFDRALRNPTLEAPGPRWTAIRSHLILQFKHPVNEDIIQKLNQRDAYVVGAVPDFGVMVSVRDGFSLDGLDIERTGRLSIEHKISEHLGRLRTASDTWVVAEFFPDVDMLEARRLAEA